MKHFKIFALISAVIILCASIKFDSFASIQFDYKPVAALPEGAHSQDYIALTSDMTEYEVKKGDTLWGISRKLLGTGTRYHEIFQANKDIISDADHIFPGQSIRIAASLYIPKDQYDRGGLVSGGAFHIAEPDMVEHRMFLSEDIENFTSFNSGITVYSLPATNHMGENALTQDWDHFVSEVERCSENCGGRVSNLIFEKYGVENGCDLYGYHFDFDTGEKIVEFAAFIRLGKHNMAEVIGLREKQPNTRMIDVTRYIAASFEDFGGRVGIGREKRRDNVGAGDWDYPELHNLFTAAMKNFLDCPVRPQENMPGDYEVTWKEPAFEQAVRSILTQLWELDEEEEKEFLNRPLMASDIAVISDIQCGLYSKNSSDDDEDSTEPEELIIRLECNGQKEEFPVSGNVSFSYEDLANFTEAEKLTIGVNDLTDYSFLANMPQLRHLCIVAWEGVEDVSFLSELTRLRNLTLAGPCYIDEDGKPTGFTGIEDLSVLENCPELRFLYLCMPQLTDFTFLEKCPDICTMMLWGPESFQGTDDWPCVCPDQKLLPNARFLEFYGESVRFEP